MKILVIDDNTEITELLSNFLKKNGFECEFTNNPWEGLEKLQKEKYDKVILDMAMPEFSGDQIIKTLATNEVLQDQNIIIFTASTFSMLERKELLRRDGINAILNKPLRLTELLDAVTN